MFLQGIHSTGAIHSEVVNTTWNKHLLWFEWRKRAQPTNNTQQELMGEWLAAESTEAKSSPDAIKILRTSISNECQQQRVVWLGRVLVADGFWCPGHTEEQIVKSLLIISLVWDQFSKILNTIYMSYTDPESAE